MFAERRTQLPLFRPFQDGTYLAAVLLRAMLAKRSAAARTERAFAQLLTTFASLAHPRHAAK